MTVSVISNEPYYLAGAFRSLARSMLNLNNNERQDACFIASIASFIKKQNAVCFASPETILATYNTHAAKYDLKPIKRSSFFIIQARCISSGVIVPTSDYSRLKARTFRKFSLDYDLICNRFSSVAKLAYSRARANLVRKMDSHHKQLKKVSNNLKNNSLDGDLCSEKWTITTKRSKDLINKNKVPDGKFYKSRFKEDADLAYGLQNNARAGTISASAAKLLIKLHEKYDVHLAKPFRSFLVSRFINVIPPKAMPSPISSPAPRKPTVATVIINTPMPAHITDSNAINLGVQLRQRVQQRVLKNNEST